MKVLFSNTISTVFVSVLCVSHYKTEADSLFVSKRVEEDFIKYAGKILTDG